MCMLQRSKHQSMLCCSSVIMHHKQDQHSSSSTRTLLASQTMYVCSAHSIVLMCSQAFSSVLLCASRFLLTTAAYLMMVRPCLQVVAKPMMPMSKTQMHKLVMLTYVLQVRQSVVMLVLPQQSPWTFES